MIKRLGFLALAIASFVLVVDLTRNSVSSQPPTMVGVNLPSATFGEQKFPGRYGADYFYPDEEDIRYFVQNGMNVIRLGFCWERLQPALDQPFDHDEERRLVDAVQAVLRQNAIVVLDVHNFARYRNRVIGSTEVPNSSFADFWERLATLFKGDKQVVFGLMNEPHDIIGSKWQRAAQAAILRIRQTGARNLILVSSSQWDGASRFAAEGDLWKDIVDPTNNLAFEVHQYVDFDSTGTHRGCPTPLAGVSALQSVAQWMRQNKRKAFLSEFGASGEKQCLAALGHMLDLIRQQPDVWLGWSYFAGGRGWADNDILSIQPISGSEKPQMDFLKKYLR